MSGEQEHPLIVRWREAVSVAAQLAAIALEQYRANPQSAFKTPEATAASEARTHVFELEKEIEAAGLSVPYIDSVCGLCRQTYGVKQAEEVSTWGMMVAWAAMDRGIAPRAWQFLCPSCAESLGALALSVMLASDGPH